MADVPALILIVFNPITLNFLPLSNVIKVPDRKEKLTMKSKSIITLAAIATIIGGLALTPSAEAHDRSFDASNRAVRQQMREAHRFAQQQYRQQIAQQNCQRSSIYSSYHPYYPAPYGAPQSGFIRNLLGGLF